MAHVSYYETFGQGGHLCSGFGKYLNDFGTILNAFILGLILAYLFYVLKYYLY